MKKAGLTIFVVLGFIAYVVLRHHEGQTALTLPSTSRGPSSSPPPAPSSASYKDGVYTGSSANAYYGNIQVQATIQGGKITDVQFLQYPNDRANSVAINQQAMPMLRQEAIQSQSAQVDVVSGATDTSNAFVQSLADALSQAKA